MDHEALLKLLGLCWVSRHVIPGQNLVSLALSQKDSSRIASVFLSSDASERTKKQITNKCTYYQVPLALLPVSSAEIAAALGKEAPLAVLAVTDRGLSEKLRSQLALQKNSIDAPL